MILYYLSLHAPALSAPAAFVAKASFSQPVTPSLLIRLGEKKTLAAALNELAKEERLSFVIEGNPVVSPRTTLAEILKKAKTKPVSARELIKQMADAYGYSVEESSGFLLFGRRCDRVDQFPEVSIAEIRHFLSSAAKVANRFDPAFTRKDGVDIEFRQFGSSLSPNIVAQWSRKPDPSNAPPGIQAMLRSHPELANKVDPMDLSTPVPTSAFSPPQQQFLKNLGLEQFIGDNVANIRRGINMIDGLGDKSTEFLYRDKMSRPNPKSPDPPKTIRSFACDYRLAGRQYRTSFSPVNSVFMNFGSAATFFNHPASTDPSDPLPSDYDAAGKALPWTEETDFSTTLGELAEKVSRQGDIALRVNPALASKRLNLIGARNKEVKALATAIAGLFNLIVRTEEEAILLDMPPTPKIARLEQVSEAIDRITPAPIKRLNYGWCVYGGPARDRRRAQILQAARRGSKEESVESDQTVSSPLRPVRISRETMKTGLDEMRKSAIRRLRILVDPKIKAAKDGRVSWEELDEEAQWLAQFIVSCEAFLFTFAQSTAGMPEYIVRFPQCQVVGRIHEDQGRTWLQIGVRTPEGGQGYNRSGILAKL